MKKEVCSERCLHYPVCHLRITAKLRRFGVNECSNFHKASLCNHIIDEVTQPQFKSANLRGISEQLHMRYATE